MGFVPFDDVIKLEAIFLQDNQRIENVHYYIVDETPNVATMTDLCAGWVETWDTYLRAAQSTDVSLVLLRAAIMETESSPGIEYSVDLPMSGGHGSPALPNNVSLAVRWLTNLRGRSFRGRTYHIGLCEDQVDGNIVTETTQVALESIYGNFISISVDVGPAVKCIASRVSHGVERVTGIATPVVNVFVDPYVDSQRRRLPGRGR